MPTPQPEAEAAIALLPPFLAARRPTAGHQCARRPRRAPLALHAHDRRPIARPRRRHLRGRPATIVRDLHDHRGREVVSSHGAGRGRCSPCVSGPWTLHHLQDHQPAEHPKRDTTSETTWDGGCSHPREGERFARARASWLNFLNHGVMGTSCAEDHEDAPPPACIDADLQRG